jgi:hypothetical protein
VPDEVLRREVVASLAAWLACVCACAPSLDGGPVVIAPTIATSQVTIDPSDAAAAPVSAAKPDVAGTWREEFDGRSGCSDVVTLSFVGTELHVESANCEDSAEYEIDEITFDGKELRFRLHVPKIDWVLDYHLTRSGDDTFVGTAEAPGADPHTVRWVREREGAAAPPPRD